MQRLPAGAMKSSPPGGKKRGEALQRQRLPLSVPDRHRSRWRGSELHRRHPRSRRLRHDRLPPKWHYLEVWLPKQKLWILLNGFYVKLIFAAIDSTTMRAWIEVNFDLDSFPRSLIPEARLETDRRGNKKVFRTRPWLR